MPEQVKVEKWQTEAAREIRTLKPNYTDARDYAEVIARHYATREREVQDVLLMAMAFVRNPQAFDDEQVYRNLKAVAAPFSAQGDGHE